MENGMLYFFHVPKFLNITNWQMHLLWIEDSADVQELTDNFIEENWAKILSKYASQVNHLLEDLLSGMSY